MELRIYFRPVLTFDPPFGAENAWDQVSLQEDGEYRDCHILSQKNSLCWLKVFPLSFTARLFFFRKLWLWTFQNGAAHHPTPNIRGSRIFWSALIDPNFESENCDGKQHVWVHKLSQNLKFLKNHLELQVEIARSPRSGGVRRSC